MNDFSGKVESGELIDRKSFMLGMMTSFAECLAGECKRCSFSPPFYPEDYPLLEPEAVRIAQEQGIYLWLEENADIMEENKVYWWVMYKYPDVLDEYHSLREKGWNPAFEFDRFRKLLSYGTVWGDNAENVTPKMRGEEKMMDTVSRVIFKPGDWPIKAEFRV
jgi:hypothetical protein